MERKAYFYFDLEMKDILSYTIPNFHSSDYIIRL